MSRPPFSQRERLFRGIKFEAALGMQPNVPCKGDKLVAGQPRSGSFILLFKLWEAKPRSNEVSRAASPQECPRYF